MKDLQDIKDLTIHDVQSIGDEYTTDRVPVSQHQPARTNPSNSSQILDSPPWQTPPNGLPTT